MNKWQWIIDMNEKLSPLHDIESPSPVRWCALLAFYYGSLSIITLMDDMLLLQEQKSRSLHLESQFSAAAIGANEKPECNRNDEEMSASDPLNTKNNAVDADFFRMTEVSVFCFIPFI
jgi:hypothetical protein